MNGVAIGTAFVGGLVSFIAPCILPIIPGFLAYLAGSGVGDEEGSHRKEIFINSVFFVLGFSLIFALLGLLLNSVLVHVAVSLQTWLSRIGGVLIIFFGLYLVGLIKISFLDRDHKFGVKQSATWRVSSRYFTSFLFGLAFAAGWTPCVGPVLGVVLGLAASAPGSAFVLLLSYALGLGVPFLIVGLFTGEATRLIARLGNSLKVVNMVFGLILIVMGVLVFLQRLTFTARMPTSDTPVVTITPLASSATSTSPRLAKNFPLAKEITTPDGFVNTPNHEAIKISDYIGKKVILIDFWTYSCINCQRTLPYLEGWYKKYENEGLMIIGIHTPEFEFEKDYQNVSDAVKRLGVTFPVVLDNDYSTWNAYNNHYWPHKYLIDIDGYIVYDHIGEGGYDESEKEIQKALQERAEVLGTGQRISLGTFNPAVTSIETASPETYFGWTRNEYLADGDNNRVGGVGGVRIFSFPGDPDLLALNTLYLNGTWDIKDEYAQTVSETTGVEYHYNAKNMYFVASADMPVVVTVTQDDKVIKTITIKEAKLYTLIENPGQEEHILRLHIDGRGLQAFTFTFG